MAWADAYASAVEYRAALRINTPDDTNILGDLKAMARLMEREVGRVFNQSALETRTFYTPTSDRASLLSSRTYGTPFAQSRVLEVDDISTKTGLVVKVDSDNDGSFTDEDAWVINTDFQLLGEEEELDPDKKPEAMPWVFIFLPDYSSQSFTSGVQVQVTAKFGFVAVPEAVKRTNIQLTAIYRMEGARATSRISESIDSVISASPTAQRLLGDLIRAYRRRWHF